MPDSPEYAAYRVDQDAAFAKHREARDAYDAKLKKAVEKYGHMREKIVNALGFTPTEPGVFDHQASGVDYLLFGMTKSSCLIKKPMQMMEGGGIPDFYSYHDWKQKIEIVIAPNKAKRRAYLLLFPDAEAID